MADFEWPDRQPDINFPSHIYTYIYTHTYSNITLISPSLGSLSLNPSQSRRHPLSIPRGRPAFPRPRRGAGESPVPRRPLLLHTQSRRRSLPRSSAPLDPAGGGGILRPRQPTRLRCLFHGAPELNAPHRTSCPPLAGAPYDSTTAAYPPTVQRRRPKLWWPHHLGRTRRCLRPGWIVPGRIGLGSG
jgi:hypothetical protein